MVSFEYQPLTSPKAIRLLEWRIGQGMEFKLLHTSLDTCPPYVALSYTWGGPVYHQEIQVDGHSFPVTTNLHDFLRQFTHRYEKAKKGFALGFWIDAICINQKDLAERGAQVRLMAEIYQRAASVEIWLGNLSPKTDFALTKLREWNEYLAPILYETRDILREDYLLENLISDNDLFIGPPGSDAYTAWEAIKELLERPWWTRAWIVQEATAKANGIVYLNCGTSRVHWGAISKLVQIRSRLKQWIDLDINEFLADPKWEAQTIDSVRASRSYSKGNVNSLLSFLTTCRGQSCTDPKDKVYSVRGMASDVGEEDLIPDYSLSLGEVYTQVADFAFRTSPAGHRLDFLGHVSRPVSGWDLTTPRHGSMPSWSDPIPSWVPDWRIQQYSIPFPKHMDAHGESLAYNASYGHLENARIRGSLLCVRGISVTQISDISRILNHSDHNASISDRFLESEFPFWPSNAGDWYPPTGELVEHAWNRIVIADFDKAANSSNPRGSSILWQLLGKPYSELSLDETQRRNAMFRRWNSTTKFRRLIWTENGYFGIGPAAAQVGDKVCVFFGGQMLYILRSKDDGSHEFIGEAYVHGLMDGEVFDTTGQARESEDFELS